LTSLIQQTSKEIAKVEAIGDGGRFGSLLAETVREVAE
jgi:hypothetical protein